MNEYTFTEDWSRKDLSYKKGDVVHRCRKHDYGLANDDTHHTGELHFSMTDQKDGGYPFFTVPERVLEVRRIA